MNPEFWHEKWARNELGFHLPQVHPLLKKHFSAARRQSIKTVFVPLCGKTLDIGWLLDQGFNVVANELSEQAIKTLFADLGLTPRVSEWHGGACYQASNISVWVGDFFQLTDNELSGVDLVYDRAALIALPQAMRAQYAASITRWLPTAQQLLITLDYDQAQMSGPPFAVSEQEVQQHYAQHWHIQCLSQKDILEHEPKFAQRGLTGLSESAFWLQPA